MKNGSTCSIGLHQNLIAEEEKNVTHGPEIKVSATVTKKMKKRKPILNTGVFTAIEGFFFKETEHIFFIYYSFICQFKILRHAFFVSLYRLKMPSLKI